MPKRKFFYHPDREHQVLDAIEAGTLVAMPDQLVEDKFMPLVDDEQKPVLGWWIDVSQLELRFPNARLSTIGS